MHNVNFLVIYIAYLSDIMKVAQSSLSGIPYGFSRQQFTQGFRTGGKRRYLMKTNIIGRQLNVYDDTKAMINEKLAKLDKYFAEEGSATVTLSHKRDLSTLEITIKASNTLFRSEVDAETFRDALDKSIDNIERQIRKNKTRLRKRLRDGVIPDGGGFNDAYDDADEAEDSEIIIRTKKFEYTPMSPQEAIMQMNLLSHTFFVFNEPTSGKTCVVYKRKDGNYGLIEPEN